MATPINRALWYALSASLFVYALIPNLLQRPVNPEAPIGLLTAVFASMSLVIAIGTIAYRRRALAGPIEAGRLDPTTPEGLQRAFPVFALNLMLSESVGIYGFVLSLLSGRAIYVLVFAAGALALLYVHRPTAPDLVPPHPGFASSDRPPPIG